METVTSTFDVAPGSQRFCGDHGWLKTYHSFSFAEYHDPAKMNWGALRVFNEDHVAGGAGFPTHPHQNMEILTYVIAGRLEHRDTLGSHGTLEAGGVQFLSAGTGLRHSEFNAVADRDLHFVQMWILPGKMNVKPSYGQVAFEPSARVDRWLVAASGESIDAPIRLTQAATLRLAHIGSVGLEHRFAPGRLGFLFVAAGSATVTARETESNRSASLVTGDALRLADIAGFNITGDAELVFWDLPRVG